MLRKWFGGLLSQPFFDADGGGAGGGQGGGNGGGQGTGNNANAGGQQAGAGSGGQGNQPFATFPDQASFTARMDREARSRLDEQAKELGFESYEAMKQAAKAKKDAEDAAKTELEKEKAARQKAEDEKKSALEAANTRLVNSEIKVFAMQAGFVDPADAVALVDRASIQVDDKGSVAGAKEAVEALAKTKPHLVGKAGGGPVGSGSNPGSGGGPDPAEAARKLAEERNKRPAPQGGYDPWATK